MGNSWKIKFFHQFLLATLVQLPPSIISTQTLLLIRYLMWKKYFL